MDTIGEHGQIAITMNRGNSQFKLDRGEMKLPLKRQIHIKEQELALVYLNIPFSWRNITADFNNRTLSYIFNGTTYPVVLPESSMSISAIDDYFQFIQIQNGHYLLDADGRHKTFITFIENQTYYAVQVIAEVIPTVLGTYTNPEGITLSGTTPQLVFDDSNFNSLLGFDKNTTVPTVNTASTSTLSPNKPDIKNISSISIECNMISNSVQLDSNIHSFTSPPTSAYGGYYSETIPYPLFFHCIDGSYSHITLTLVDQDGRRVSLLDEDITMRFVLQDKQRLR